MKTTIQVLSFLMASIVFIIMLPALPELRGGRFLQIFPSVYFPEAGNATSRGYLQMGVETRAVLKLGISRDFIFNRELHTVQEIFLEILDFLGIEISTTIIFNYRERPAWMKYAAKYIRLWPTETEKGAEVNFDQPRPEQCTGSQIKIHTIPDQGPGAG